MAAVSTKALKMGDRLAKDVFTKRNNLLMHKDTVLTQREIDILQAFLIKQVDIYESSATEAPVEQAERPFESASSDLHKEYAEMVSFMKNLFTIVGGGGTLPALDVRKRVESLISHIDEYKIFQFKPQRYVIHDYIYHHSVHVAMTSYLLGKWTGLPQKDWMPLALAGLLHNIGVTGIDSDILHKPKALTPGEMTKMREHTVIGYNIIKSIHGFNNGVKMTTLQHHEREDGSGYPLGLSSENIHPYAKIVAVADMYHAMNLDRVYRNAISPYLVMEELNEYAFGKLDPKIVRTLLEKIALFATGTVVRLSDGRIGEIVFIQRESPTRPWVSVDGSIINLAQQKTLYIEEILIL